MTVTEGLRDRRATRRERHAANAYRRQKDVPFSKLAERLDRPDKWVWERVSEKATLRVVMLSELRRIRAAIDELVAERGRI